MEYKIFWVAVIEQPKKKKDEEPDPPIMVIDPKPVLAKDEQDAAIRTVMDSEELKGRDRNRLEVKVRPF